MSDSESTTSRSSGVLGAVAIITIVFVVLKLTHVVAWSWWWVLSPLWIDAAVWAAIGLVALTLWCIGQMIERRRRGW